MSLPYFLPFPILKIVVMIMMMTIKQFLSWKIYQFFFQKGTVFSKFIFQYLHNFFLYSYMMIQLSIYLSLGYNIPLWPSYRSHHRLQLHIKVHSQQKPLIWKRHKTLSLGCHYPGNICYRSLVLEEKLEEQTTATTTTIEMY